MDNYAVMVFSTGLHAFYSVKGLEVAPGRTGGTKQFKIIP